jgi:hypothetical protein
LSEEEEEIWAREDRWCKKGKKVVKINDEVCIELEEGMDTLESGMESGFHRRVYLWGVNSFV